MDLSKTMVCPKCGNTVAVTDQFCSKCFERLERPSFWRRLGAWFQSAFKPGPHTLVIRKDERFQTVDRQNAKHVYHSLGEMPPDVRATFEKLQSETAKGMDAKQLLSELLKGKQKPGTFVSREDFQEFRIQDESGKEQVHHSLEEMPPEIREAFEKAGSEATKDLEVTKELDAEWQSSSAISKDMQKSGFIVRKNFQEFRFKDALGKEQVYHSLDEMPPETRALFEKLRGRLD
jgi:hypothetical protein